MTFIPEYKLCSFEKLNKIVEFCDNSSFMKESQEFGAYGIKGYSFNESPNFFFIVGARGFAWAKYGYHYFEYYSTEEILKIVNPEIKKVILFNLDIFN